VGKRHANGVAATAGANHNAISTALRFQDHASRLAFG
jgi:hypothetical protein